MTSLTIEVQRFIVEMILQRQSRDDRFAVKDLTRVESANHSALFEAQMAFNGKELVTIPNYKNPDGSRSPHCGI